MEYKVKWEIDVDAENPVDAARICKLIQLDPDSTATVFKVTELHHELEQETLIVDLGKEYSCPRCESTSIVRHENNHLSCCACNWTTIH